MIVTIYFIVYKELTRKNEEYDDTLHYFRNGRGYFHYLKRASALEKYREHK